MNGTGKTSFSRNAKAGTHVDAFSLINMPVPTCNASSGNGRIYDPRIGQFLSADPFVQVPHNSQSFNRYSYVNNNPLKFSDPSGYYKEAIDPGFQWDWSRLAGKGPIGPGSGNHWSDRYRSEYGNFFLMSSNTFDNYYGEGSYDLVTDKIMKIKELFKIWREGKISLNDFRNNKVVKVKVSNGKCNNSLLFTHTQNGWKIIGYYTDDGDVYFGMTNNVTIVPAEDNALLDLSTWYDLMGYGGDDFSLPAMYLHFQFGGHQPMTIKMSSMDFSGTSQRELGLTGMTPGDIRKVNLFKAGPLFQPALAFGNVRMKYLGNDQFTIVGDKNARFDFSPLVGGSSIARDAGNVFGAYINYNIWAIPISPLLVIPPLVSGPYDVKFVGSTIIPK